MPAFMAKPSTSPAPSVPRTALKSPKGLPSGPFSHSRIPSCPSAVTVQTE